MASGYLYYCSVIRPTEIFLHVQISYTMTQTVDV